MDAPETTSVAITRLVLRWLSISFSALLALVAVPVVAALGIVAFVVVHAVTHPAPSPRWDTYRSTETSWLDRPGAGGITMRPWVVAGAILGAVVVCAAIPPCRENVLAAPDHPAP